MKMPVSRGTDMLIAMVEPNGSELEACRSRYTGGEP